MERGENSGEMEEAFAVSARGAEVLEFLGSKESPKTRAGRRLAACEDLFEFEQLEPRILLSATDPVPDAEQPAALGNDFGSEIAVEMDDDFGAFDTVDPFKYVADEEEIEAGDLPEVGGEDAGGAEDKATPEPSEGGQGDSMIVAQASARVQQAATVASENLADGELVILIDDPASGEPVRVEGATEELVATLRAGRGPPNGRGEDLNNMQSEATMQFLASEHPDMAAMTGPGVNLLTLRLAEDRVENTLQLVDGSGIVRQEQLLAKTERVHIVGLDLIDDTLTVDFTHGMFDVPIFYDGGAAGFDTLVIDGGVFDTAVYTASGPDAGTIVLDGTVITYVGLEPIVDNGVIANRVFTATAGADVIRLKNYPVAGMMIIESDDGTFESIAFPNPTGSLTIDGGGGEDRFIVESLDPGFTPIDSASGDPELRLVFEGNDDDLEVPGSLELFLADDSYGHFGTEADIRVEFDGDLPIFNAGNLKFTASDGDETITLEVAGGDRGLSFIVSGSSSFAFHAPSENLTIDSGGGEDTIVIEPFDPADPPSGTSFGEEKIHIIFGDQDDTFKVLGSLALDFDDDVSGFGIIGSTDPFFVEFDVPPMLVDSPILTIFGTDGDDVFSLANEASDSGVMSLFVSSLTASNGDVEALAIRSPSERLTFDAGPGDDTIEVLSLDPGFLPGDRADGDPEMSLEFGEGVDTLKLGGVLDLFISDSGFGHVGTAAAFEVKFDDAPEQVTRPTGSLDTTQFGGLVVTESELDLVITGTAGDDEIRLSNNPGSGLMQIESVNGTFEKTVFLNPFQSLTIDGGAGRDTIIVDSLDPAFEPIGSALGGPELHLVFEDRELVDGDILVVPGTLELFLDDTSYGHFGTEGNIRLEFDGDLPLIFEASNLIFTGTDNAETITLQVDGDDDLGDPTAFIRSSLLEARFFFEQPSESLTINTGDGLDRIEVVAVHPDFPPSGTIFGDAEFRLVFGEAGDTLHVADRLEMVFGDVDYGVGQIGTAEPFRMEFDVLPFSVESANLKFVGSSVGDSIRLRDELGTAGSMLLSLYPDGDSNGDGGIMNLSIPSESLTIDAGGGDDTITISSLDPGLTPGDSADGDPEVHLVFGDGADTLYLEGALALFVNDSGYGHVGTAAAFEVKFDDVPEQVVSSAASLDSSGYSGAVLETSGSNFTFTATAGADEIRLRRAEFSGVVVIESGNGSFAPIVVSIPELSLTIDAGGGDDRIIIDSFGPGFVPGENALNEVELHLRFGAGTDVLLHSNSLDLFINDAAFGHVGAEEFRVKFDDVPEQAVFHAPSLDASLFSGVAVLVEGIPDWVEQGPGQIDTPRTEVAPYPQVGAVEVIALHPFDENIIFAGSVNGGVWLSEDAGGSWIALTDQFPSLSIGAVTIASHDADGTEVSAATPRNKLVVYAGTGQFSSSGDGGFAVGVLKSEDGGDTWELLTSAELAGRPVTSIVAERIAGQAVVLVATAGAVRTVSVTAKVNGSPLLTFADANPDTITRSAGSWIDDGFRPGMRITVSDTADARNDASYRITSVAETVLTLSSSSILVDEGPSAGAVITVGLQSQITREGGIFRSVDGGTSFELDVLVQSPRDFGPRGRLSPISSVTDLVVDPGNSNRLYAGVTGGGVFRSDDGGENWTAVNTGLGLTGDGMDNNHNGRIDDSGETATGALRVMLAVQQGPTPEGNAVFAALISTDESLMGVFRSSNHGDSWELLGDTPPPTVGRSGGIELTRISVDGTISFLDTNSDTITAPGNWERDGFVPGMTLTITGAGENDGTYTVASGAGAVTASTLTLVGGDMLMSVAGVEKVKVVGESLISFAATGTIARNLGDWREDGFMVGHRIQIGGSGLNNGSYIVTGVTQGTLTVSGDLTEEIDRLGVTVVASVDALQGPSTQQPQTNRGTQGDKHFAFAADAAGNVFVGGDRPNHIFRWTASTQHWVPIVGASTNGTAAHADSRFITFDRRGVLLEADDGGVYRLLNPTGPAITVVGNPELTFTASNSQQIGSHLLERSAGSWVDDGFRVGQWITVTGSPGNNDSYLITGISTFERELSLASRVRRTDDGPRTGILVTAEPQLLGVAQITGQGRDIFEDGKLTFADANSDTITRTAGSWITDGFAVGQRILVSGSALNDGAYTIAARTATVLTLEATDELEAETSAGVNVRSGTTLTFADRNGSDTITRSTGDWASEGFAVGQEIIVSGTSENDGVYSILVVTPLALILDASDELTAEVAGGATVTAGHVWQSLNNGLGVTEIYSIAYDALNNVLLIGTQDNGVAAQARADDGLDNDGDGIIDEEDEALQWSEFRIVYVAGDGNTVTTIPIDSDEDAKFDQVLRIAMNNNLRSLGSVLIDAEGDAVPGTANLFLLRSDPDQTHQFEPGAITLNDGSATENTITLPGHGLADGAGPFWFSTLDGTVPSSLRNFLHYYVISVDADTIQLATSKANAVSATPVAIDLDTAAGTGTHRLSMRFTGLTSSDSATFTSTSRFSVIPYVVNAIDSTRMLLGLFNVYASRNIGTPAEPEYDRLDTIERVGQVDPGYVSALAYGGTRNGIANPDVIYAAASNSIDLFIGHALTGDPALDFAEIVNGDSTLNTVTRASGSWLGDGFAVGQSVRINGGLFFIDGKVSAVTDTELSYEIEFSFTTAEGDPEWVAGMGLNGVRFDLTSSETIAGVVRIRDIVLDPDDWSVAYAVADSGVYMRQGTDEWVLISQQLPSFDFRSVAIYQQDGTDVLVVGSVTGVFRALTPTPNVSWTEFGRGLPNSLVRDVLFVGRDASEFENPDSLSRDDLLVAATLGRGAWIVEGLDGVIATPSRVTIEGSSGNDVIRIERRSTNAAIVDVFVNGSVPIYSAPATSIGEIIVLGGGGDDQLTIDSTNGAINLAERVQFDGGAGSNELVLEGTDVVDFRQVTAGSKTTATIDDARGNLRQEVIYENASLTNNLEEASVLDKIRSIFTGAFAWLGEWLNDSRDGAGAEDELALIGHSLPRALSGTSSESESAIADPVEGAQQLVQNGVLVAEPGLQRLIEEGENGFSLLDIGTLISTPGLLASRLDALDSTAGNVTFDDTTDLDGDGIADLRITVQIIRRLEGSADFDLVTSLLGGEIDLSGEIGVGAEVVLNLVLGVESTGGGFIDVSGGGSGLTIRNLQLSGELEAEGRIGFLGVEVSGVEVRVDPELALNVVLQEPSGDGKMRFSELFGSLRDPARFNDLGTISLSGSASPDLVLEATVEAGLVLPGAEAPFSLGGAQFTATWDEITAVDDVEIEFRLCKTINYRIT